MKKSRRVLPDECVGVTGVTIYPYGKKHDEKFVGALKPGKRLLLTPDEKTVVAVADSHEPIWTFIRANHLKGYVTYVVEDPAAKAIF